MIGEDNESNNLNILFLIIGMLVMLERKLQILTHERFGLKGKRFEAKISLVEVWGSDWHLNAAPLNES